MKSQQGPHRPTRLTELFWAFTWLSLQGFGGVLAVVHRELVEKRQWMTAQEFLEDWALAQVMPGPNVCNLALMFGDRHFGTSGAAVALAGLLTMPLLLLVGLSTLIGQIPDQAVAAGGLRGMGAVSVGLIAGSALKLLTGLQRHVLGLRAVLSLAAGAFACAVLWHQPLHFIVLGLGSVACGLTWWSLRKQAAP